MTTPTLFQVTKEKAINFPFVLEELFSSRELLIDCERILDFFNSENHTPLDFLYVLKEAKEVRYITIRKGFIAKNWVNYDYAIQLLDFINDNLLYNEQLYLKAIAFSDNHRPKNHSRQQFIEQLKKSLPDKNHLGTIFCPQVSTYSWYTNTLERTSKISSSYAFINVYGGVHWDSTIHQVARKLIGSYLTTPAFPSALPAKGSVASVRMQIKKRREELDCIR